uniref:EOG090X0GXS n=1 Tax=Eubosmina coregoni TaxID=186181 RepID=A0A4Y7LPA5_9CRUS|nr:EOG090X0GXS [Eubosmina coregoni]SVE70146.1 EOG090X0GXS [Eubosmina coregoni]
MNAGQRESIRQKDANARRILDDAARRRRARKALEALEQDNFHDDPHANLVLSKKIPKFEESLDGKQTRRRKSKNFENFKQRYRKSLAQLLEEEQGNRPEPPNYVSAQVGASQFPERRFCAVCGFPSNYTCLSCGARYCCVKCLGTHTDTRYRRVRE